MPIFWILKRCKSHPSLKKKDITKASANYMGYSTAGKALANSPNLR